VHKWPYNDVDKTKGDIKPHGLDHGKRERDRYAMENYTEPPLPPDEFQLDLQPPPPPPLSAYKGEAELEEGELSEG